MSRDVVKELYDLYSIKTANEIPEYSFYAWLGAMDIEATTKAWLDVLNHPDKYGLDK